MSEKKLFDLNTLTEDIRARHVGQENTRLVEKWDNTGLLHGLGGQNKDMMSRLLENQCAELLREASSLSTGAGNLATSGDMRGFQNIAFPIVRRVFGGLLANELISIQPMSLPSGLLFYLDYTYGTDTVTDGQEVFAAGDSIYGDEAGAAVRTGSLGTGGQYDLVGTSYSRVNANYVLIPGDMVASGAFNSSGDASGISTLQTGQALVATGSDAQLIDFDP